MYSIISQCHQAVGHSGRDKTWDKVNSNYSWIRRDAVKLFLDTCPDCNIRKPVKRQKTSKSEISLCFMGCVHLNLIDMTSKQDGVYNWILHVTDHLSKYLWTFPLKSNTLFEIAENLNRLFCMFGMPKVLKSDLSKDLVTAIISDIRNQWPGCQISVDSHHTDQEFETETLLKRLNDHVGTWSSALSFVTHAINTSPGAGSEISPYERVFGQKPTSQLQIGNLHTSAPNKHQHN